VKWWRIAKVKVKRGVHTNVSNMVKEGHEGVGDDEPKRLSIYHGPHLAQGRQEQIEMMINMMLTRSMKELELA